MTDAVVKHNAVVAATAATSTAWVDLATIAAVDFEAGKTYLILANQICQNSSASAEGRIRLVHGTTPTVFDDASLAYEGFATNQKHLVSYMFFYTQPGTAELVKLQISSSTTNTTTNFLSQIIAIKLSDDFV